MKAIKDAKEKYGLPEDENKIMTNFIKQIDTMYQSFYILTYIIIVV